MPQTHDENLIRLHRLVQKVLANTPGVGSLDFRVLPSTAPESPYFIEISKERLARTVSVSRVAIKRMDMGETDPGLVRDLRTTIIQVWHRAGQRR